MSTIIRSLSLSLSGRLVVLTGPKHRPRFAAASFDLRALASASRLRVPDTRGPVPTRTDFRAAAKSMKLCAWYLRKKTLSFTVGVRCDCRSRRGVAMSAACRSHSLDNYHAIQWHVLICIRSHAAPFRSVRISRVLGYSIVGCTYDLLDYGVLYELGLSSVSFTQIPFSIASRFTRILLSTLLL